MAARNDLIPVYVLLAVSGTSLLLWASFRYVEYRLRQWAEDRGCTLVRWRHAWPWQGPRAWRRWRHQQDYYVAVLERGRGRTGWVMVNWPIFGVGRPTIRAQWDGCMPEYDED
jgi:hypothetical protein